MPSTERGIITFQEKVTRVEAAGAVAAVVYNNREGLFRGALASQSGIPVVSISFESGQTILALLAEGDVEAIVSVMRETRDTQNVIAEKPGTTERVVLLGIGLLVGQIVWILLAIAVVSCFTLFQRMFTIRHELERGG